MNSPARSDTAWQLLSASAIVMLALIGGALWLLPAYNSEYRGDLPHHALMLSERLVPNCPSRYDAPYPKGSYLLSSLVLPFSELDPYRAIRSTSIGLVGFLLCCQFFVLRRFMSWQLAIVTLFAWQWLCFETKTANQNFFYGAYFYSQAVGTSAVWLAVLLYTDSAGNWLSRTIFRTAAVALVVFVFQCHLVPSLVGVGALILLSAAQWFERRNWLTLAEFLAVVAISAGMLLFTDQIRYMNHCSTCDGGLPIRNLPILLLWIPTAIVVVGSWGLRAAGRGSAWLYDKREEPLYALLLAAAVVQGYCYYRHAYCGNMAAYAVKKLFFYTFPVASLLLAIWSQRLLSPVLARMLANLNVRFALLRPVYQLGAIGLLVAALVQNYKECLVDEFKSPISNPDATPTAIAKYLSSLRSSMPPALYFDPVFPHASVYVSVVGLEQNLFLAYLCHEFVAGRISAEELARRAGIEELILPDNVSALTLFGRDVVGQPIGRQLIRYPLRVESATVISRTPNDNPRK